jgi:type I restriction enzyme S subunit
VLVQRSNTIDLVGTTAVFTGPINEYVYPDLMMRLRIFNPVVGQLFWRHANSNAGRRYFVREAASSTGSMPKLTGNKLRSMSMVLPPTRAEQEAIAGVLSDADALIESLEQLVAKKRQVKHGVMQELLTGQKRLPGFTGEWQTKRLGELGSTYGGLAGINKSRLRHGSRQIHYVSQRDQQYRNQSRRN